MFLLILTQTLRLAFRKGGGAFGTVAFYSITAILFNFAFGPQNIHGHAAAVLCVALLLSTITALPLFYERDYEDGMLEQYLLQPCVLEWLVLAKICGQWLANIGPILIASPLFAIMADLTGAETAQMMWMLLLASPTIISLGSIAAALTLGARRGGLLQSLIVMPLMVPVLIFASAGGQGAWLFLCGLLFAALPLSCFVSAALIRMSQD